MSVKTIATDELRKKFQEEGLILQGCGGDPQEWVDGINEMFTKEGILLNGTKFQNCSVFEHDGRTCILYPFGEGVDVNIGKLAMWRLQTRANFGGVWLSDFVENEMGGYLAPEQQPVRKPDCPLIGQNGNIFNLMAIASRTLDENGMEAEAKEMRARIHSADSYYQALGIIGEYVNITSVDDGMGDGDFDEDVSPEEETGAMTFGGM
jgi:hypothetical protein